MLGAASGRLLPDVTGRFGSLCAGGVRLSPARSGRWTQQWQMSSIADAAFGCRRQGLPSPLSCFSLGDVAFAATTSKVKKEVEPLRKTIKEAIYARLQAHGKR